MDVGNNIKKIRELKNFSQTFMAQQLGVSQKTYSNIEKSKNNIKLETIHRVAEILDVSMKTIFEFNAETVLGKNSLQESLMENNNNEITLTKEKAFELLELLVREKNLRIEELKKALEAVKKKK